MELIFMHAENGHLEEVTESSILSSTVGLGDIFKNYFGKTDETMRTIIASCLQLS